MGWASAGRASRFVTDLEGQAANLGELMGSSWPVTRSSACAGRAVPRARHKPPDELTDSHWVYVGLTYLDYTHKPAWKV